MMSMDKRYFEPGQLVELMRNDGRRAVPGAIYEVSNILHKSSRPSCATYRLRLMVGPKTAWPLILEYEGGLLHPVHPLTALALQVLE